MSNHYCTNINTCRMVATDQVVTDKKEKEAYINNWCRQHEEKWLSCKRYHTKKALGFCPDFVVPDTELSIDEIIDKFENETTD